MFIEEILTEKCWKGYEKKGMKTMFGKRVPNCVKKEEVEVDEKYDSDEFFSGRGTPEQRLQLLKLTNKALKTFPNSPKQKEVRKEIDALRKEMGMNVNEDLRKWFKDKWVRFGPDGKIRGDCARGSKSEGKPKCLPKSKAQSLGKKGRKTAASRKRREDPNKNRKGKAKNVRTK